MFSFPFPRHFHQASHVGVKYIPKYWEQHCGGREQEAVGSLEGGGQRERWRVKRRNRGVESRVKAGCRFEDLKKERKKDY